MEPYLKDPARIYAASFAIVRELAVLSSFDDDLAEIAVRVIHACGMPNIVDDLEADAGFVPAVVQAIASGGTIFCDCEMVASGITRRFLGRGNEVVVTLNDPRTPHLAEQLQTTRSAAAVELWQGRLEGGIVVIGNAPTALFHLMESIEAGGAKPAAIIGCPVGFVGAAESKAALATSQLGVPFLVVHGTRGGSAMASAVINAAALLANEKGTA